MFKSSVAGSLEDLNKFNKDSFSLQRDERREFSQKYK